MSDPNHMREQIEKAKSEAWVRGVGYALAELQRAHDSPVIVVDVARAAGLDYDDFKRSGLEEYDLKVLRIALIPVRPSPEKRM